MLIVSSPTYGMTKWTFRELQMADNNQKKLVRTNTRQHSPFNTGTFQVTSSTGQLHSPIN